MKKSISVTFDYECDDGVGGIELIKNDFLSNFSGVAGDGEVFINSIEIDDIKVL